MRRSATRVVPSRLDGLGGVRREDGGRGGEDEEEGIEEAELELEVDSAEGNIVRRIRRREAD